MRAAPDQQPRVFLVDPLLSYLHIVQVIKVDVCHAPATATSNLSDARRSSIRVTSINELTACAGGGERHRRGARAQFVRSTPVVTLGDQQQSGHRSSSSCLPTGPDGCAFEPLKKSASVFP
jgi:hypothetical protein